MSKIDLKTKKEKLLEVGYIEIKLYSDTSFAYLMRPNKIGNNYDMCLDSYEFDYDVEDAIIKLYDSAKKKGLFDY